MRNPEYNSDLITFLQLIHEGRIVSKAGFDWRSVVENARVRWIQLERFEKDKTADRLIQLKKVIDDCFSEKCQELTSKVEEASDQITSQLDDHTIRFERAIEANTAQLLATIEMKLNKKLRALKIDLKDAMMQTLLTSVDVDRQITSKFKKRKMRHHSSRSIN